MAATITTIQAGIKRGFLQSLSRAATSAGTPLLTALNSFQDNGFSALQTGRLIIGSSGNGKSVSFKMGQIGEQFTQENIFMLAQEFQETYADALVTLSLVNKPDTSQDAAIFTAMMAADNMQSIRTFETDYTAIRYPTWGGGV